MNTLVIPVTVSETREWYEITIAGDESIDVELSSTVSVVGGDYYTGDYEVTPKSDTAVILPTEGLVMRDDVTVRKIPYYETSNPTGLTVYIASEV